MTGPLISRAHVLAVLTMAGLEDDPIFVAVQDLPKVEVPTREAVARLVADQMYDGYDNALRNKREWTDRRGEKGGRYRDINEPFQCDYDECADAILALLTPGGAGACSECGGSGYVEKHVPGFKRFFLCPNGCQPPSTVSRT